MCEPTASGAGLSEHRGDDSVVLRNANTTIGYARFSQAERRLDYIFVNPAFRRRGYIRRLLSLCEDACGGALTPAPPISPLGQRFFKIGTDLFFSGTDLFFSNSARFADSDKK